MNNQEAQKMGYLKLERSHQLGNLASELARIRRNLQEGDEVGKQIVLSSIETCQDFTEWTITTLDLMNSESDLNLAEELLRIGRQLTVWKFHVQEVFETQEKRLESAAIAQQWSQELLAKSGLLQSSEPK
ncbi:hypothetical protein ACQ4M3_31505 [Leptolyngbya sp. AN03gr2]|uniref:hypothetical protein n=1 Tax=unclassified Leptolyngbya TaxID=2650499 RepID=UPI003D31D400